MDKHCEMLGWKKEYLMCQACNLLGIAVGEVKFGNLKNEDENISNIKEMLDAYPFGTHYFAQSNIDGAHEDFIKESFPNTAYLIKEAAASGNLNREKWMPLLNLFFQRTKEYLTEYEAGKEN